MWTTFVQLTPYAIIFTIPLLITALGALFSERSGVVNIGLEGLMIVGSFTGALVIAQLQQFWPSHSWVLWLGLLAAMVAGVLLSLLHAFASIHLSANQIISGTAINMMALAITVFLARNMTGSGNIHIKNGFIPSDIPLLSSIPLLGEVLFKHTYPTTWLIVILLIASSFLLYRTPFGLRLRACGENPHAADAAGIHVSHIRYIGVMISGAFSGLGGAIITVTYADGFSGSVAGLGFLALASLIFGQWRPLGVLAATLFFGFASTIANVSQVIPTLSEIPPVILKVFPYVITLIALILFSKSSQAPKAVGEPFDRSKA